AGRDGIDKFASSGGIEGTAQGATSDQSRFAQSRHAIDSLQRDRGSPGNPVPLSGYAAGSEGFSGDEDASSPVRSASQITERRRDVDESDKEGAGMKPSEPSHVQQHNTVQSESSLSQGRDSIAEEVSFDQQSDFARHVGQLSSEDPNGENSGLPNAEVIAKAMQQKRPEPEV
ncbi:MAG: hypothetical protein ACO1NO_06675, partial [Burkholderiaceae bacterium]